MARRKKAGVSRKAAVSREETRLAPIIQRPDGYYWEPKGGKPRGPFDTREEAEIDRIAGGFTEGEFEAGESLQEAESEIGMSEWIDPDTGDPAEGSIPRLEDH